MSESGRDRFECGECGSRDILIPENPGDKSIVRCGSCERELATWATARAHLHKLALRLDGRSRGERVRLTSV